MPIRPVSRLAILALVAGVIPLVLAGIIFHVTQLLEAVAIAALLLIAMFIPKCPTSPPTPQRKFRILLAGSLIYFAGAAFGLAQWYRDGFPWDEGLALLFPLALAGWLLWVALRTRRTASANSGRT